ncbi:PREDICTED: heat stress transcription factor A-6a-like [Camelina sativa]|uniref:Heat stress transcription factor A-6a-like n=1 Tax=Camelina sativa TaxID=90675 RepID=A0ABM0TTK6_CAMSA|nr:PREDICTED: heat stress transcription factor A-6a-like [Camelina sativa]
MVHNYFPRGLSLFYVRVYQVVDDPSTDSIISWGSNNSFIIWNVEGFRRKIMPTCVEFGITFSSFVSRLRSHGFKRVKGPRQLEFGDEYFVVDQPELLKLMMVEALRTKRNAKKAKAKAKKDRVQVEEEQRELVESESSVKFLEVVVSKCMLLLPNDDGMEALRDCEYFRGYNRSRLLWERVQKELEADPPGGYLLYASHLQLLVSNQLERFCENKDKKMNQAVVYIIVPH